MKVIFFLLLSLTAPLLHAKSDYVLISSEENLKDKEHIPGYDKENSGKHNGNGGGNGNAPSIPEPDLYGIVFAGGVAAASILKKNKK